MPEDLNVFGHKLWVIHEKQEILFADFDAEGCLFAVDVPFGGVSVNRAYNEIIGNNCGETERSP